MRAEAVRAAPSKGIGTRRETSLHEALKIRYTGPGGNTEVVHRGFVCDGIDASGTIIEVQTSNFAAIYRKLESLSREAKLVLVYPVIKTCYLELYDTGKHLIRRRKSPKKGGFWDIFNELIYAPLLPSLSNLRIELALVDAAERRIQDGKGSWRRRGVSIADRSLLALHETLSLAGVSSYRRFIPPELKGNFTVRELAAAAKIGETTARKTVYVLTRLNLIERTGKKGRAFVYRRVITNHSPHGKHGKEEFLPRGRKS
ncbi:MAG: hypothetical protein LBI85_07285 [Spirochaetaceae bacterium]|jgi:hypothetical protein|nr:hypothetical protein [Spirochaetaceae bacterium]